MIQKKGILRIANWLEKNNCFILYGIILFVVSAGAFYSWILGDTLRFLPDEQDYLTLADHLAHQSRYTLDGIQPTAYRPPGYPFFLSIFSLFGVQTFGLRLLNFLLLGAGLYLGYRLLAQQESRLAGVIGVLFSAAYPLLFFTAGTFYPQVYAGALLLLITWMLARPNPGSVSVSLAGLMFGLLILSIPLFILTLGIYFLWLLFYRSWKTALLFLLTALFVVGLWTARNKATLDSWVFVSTNSGENLLLGNSENTTPNGGRTVDISAYENTARDLDEVTRDRYFRDQAVNYIVEHPMKTLGMYALKVLNYFNYRNELVTSSEGSRIKDLIMLVYYGPILAIFLLRLLMIRQVKITGLEALLVSVYLSGAFFSAIFFTRIRFRLPYDLPMILCVALFLSRIIRARQEMSGGNDLMSTTPGQ